MAHSFFVIDKFALTNLDSKDNVCFIDAHKADFNGLGGPHHLTHVQNTEGRQATSVLPVRVPQDLYREMMSEFEAWNSLRHLAKADGAAELVFGLNTEQRRSLLLRRQLAVIHCGHGGDRLS